MRVVITERNGVSWTLRLVADETFEEISQARMPLTCHLIVRGWFERLNAVLSNDSLPAWERLCDQVQQQQLDPVNREAPLAPARQHRPAA